MQGRLWSSIWWCCGVGEYWGRLLKTACSIVMFHTNQLCKLLAERFSSFSGAVIVLLCSEFKNFTHLVLVYFDARFSPGVSKWGSDVPPLDVTKASLINWGWFKMEKKLGWKCICLLGGVCVGEPFRRYLHFHKRILAVKKSTDSSAEFLHLDGSCS